MTRPDYSMARATIRHIEKYVNTRNEHYLHLAGVVLTMAPDQNLTLNRIAPILARKPDAHLDAMVRAMGMTNGIISFNMRFKVQVMRAVRA